MRFTNLPVSQRTSTPDVDLASIPFATPGVEAGEASSRACSTFRNSLARVERSIAYMHENIARPLRISKLAAMADLSRSHYSALFRHHTGRAPIEYFIQLRMQRACWFLQMTPSSIKQVAADLGYDDQFYFSRLFKSVTGVSPSEYRAKATQVPQRTALPPFQ